jgi:hypothetical protein
MLPDVAVQAPTNFVGSPPPPSEPPHPATAKATKARIVHDARMLTSRRALSPAAEKSFAKGPAKSKRAIAIRFLSFIFG